MAWLALVLVLIGVYGTIRLSSLGNSRNRLKYLGLTIACAIFTVIFTSSAIAQFTAEPQISMVTDILVEWGHVLALAFVLSSLAAFIRESKPVFAQFPLAYTALPLLIVISYVLVQDTYAIREWLLFIYQGGAILVALLMYAVYTYRNLDYLMIMLGMVLFAISYSLYWYLPGIEESYPWAWQISLGISIVLTVFGYGRIHQKSFLNQPTK